MYSILLIFQELCDKGGSPLGSTGSVADSIKSESPAGSVPEDRKGLEAGVFAVLSWCSDYIVMVILFFGAW